MDTNWYMRKPRNNIKNVHIQHRNGSENGENSKLSGHEKREKKQETAHDNVWTWKGMKRTKTYKFMVLVNAHLCSAWMVV